MTIEGSLMQGVTGMPAQSARLDMIADNLDSPRPQWIIVSTNPNPPFPRQIRTGDRNATVVTTETNIQDRIAESVSKDQSAPSQPSK